MKTLTKIIAALAAVLMLYGLAAVGLNAVFNRTGWLLKEYRDELNIEEETGYTAETASFVLGRMMHYATGRDADLDVTIEEYGEEVSFFNESELSHMRDVRKLTRTVLISGAVCLCLSVAAVVLFIVFKKREALRVFAKAYLIALGVAVAAIIALAIWVLIDFDSFWTMFHRVFFAGQGNWTFDPAVSRMIRICPAELFADFVGKLGSYAAILTGAAGAACALYLVKGKRKEAQ